jgi:hypothetical protein
MIYQGKEAIHAAPILAELSRIAHRWKGTTGKEDHDGDNYVFIVR